MSRRFGPVRQNGYVVRDVEAALKHWTEVLGVVELSEISGAKGRFFERVREAAATWDGREPIRRR